MREKPRKNISSNPFATPPSGDNGKSSNSKGNASVFSVPILIILLMVFKNQPKVILIIIGLCLLTIPFMVIIGLKQKSAREKQMKLEADLERAKAEKIAQSDKIRAQIGRRLARQRKLADDEIIKGILIEKIGELVKAIYIAKKAEEHSNKQELIIEENNYDSQDEFGQEKYSYDYYS